MALASVYRFGWSAATNEGLPEVIAGRGGPCGDGRLIVGDPSWRAAADLRRPKVNRIGTLRHLLADSSTR